MAKGGRQQYKASWQKWAPWRTPSPPGARLALGDDWPALGTSRSYSNLDTQPWSSAANRTSSQNVTEPKAGRDVTWCKVCSKFTYNDQLEKCDYTCRFCGIFLKGRGAGSHNAAGGQTNQMDISASLGLIIAKGGAAAEQAKLLQSTLAQAPAASPKPPSVRLSEASQKVERAEGALEKVATRVIRLEKELASAMDQYKEQAANLADATVAQEAVAKELAPEPVSQPVVGQMDVRELLENRAELNLSFGGLFEDVELEEADRVEFERSKTSFETEFKSALSAQFSKMVATLAEQQQKKVEELGSWQATKKRKSSPAPTEDHRPDAEGGSAGGSASTPTSTEAGTSTPGASKGAAAAWAAVDPVATDKQKELKSIMEETLAANPPSILALEMGCTEAGLAISPNSTIVTNQVDLGKALRKGFQKVGFTVKIACVATDLGIDRGAVGFLRPKQAQRRGGAAARFNRLRVGRKGPQYQIVHRLIESWMAIIFQPGLDLELARRTWRAARRRTEMRAQKDRWRGITGVASATIATLFDNGWGPVGPWAWISDSGARFMAPDSIIGQGQQDMSELKEAVSDSIDRMLWDRAPRHWNGKGAGEGADLRGARRRINSLRKEGENEMAGALEAEQTINRGETTALLRALEDLHELDIPMTFVTDSGYVLKGIAMISSGRLPTTNLDLWLQAAAGSPRAGAIALPSEAAWHRRLRRERAAARALLRAWRGSPSPRQRGRLVVAAALLDGHHGSAAPAPARQAGDGWGGIAAASGRGGHACAHCGDRSGAREPPWRQGAVGGRGGAPRGRPAALVAEAAGRQRSGSQGVRIVDVAQALEPDADPEEVKLAQLVELLCLSGDEPAEAKYRQQLDALRAQRLARPLSVAEARRALPGTLPRRPWARCPPFESSAQARSNEGTPKVGMGSARLGTRALLALTLLQAAEAAAPRRWLGDLRWGADE
ncbi:unnamed protein product, partial [Prorocentrum cordatum]